MDAPAAPVPAAPAAPTAQALDDAALGIDLASRRILLAACVIAAAVAVFIWCLPSEPRRAAERE